jgi:hypothetical protein
MITKEEVRSKLLDAFTKHPHAHGIDTYQIITEFIITEKICPTVVSDVLEELKNENYVMEDGRHFITCAHVDIPLGTEFTNELWAHKHLHNGGIKCPKESKT